MRESYFVKTKKMFFNRFGYSARNIEFINAYCDAIEYNLKRAGFKTIDSTKIRTTQRTRNSFVVLYDTWIVFIITVVLDENHIWFDTKMV